MKNLSHDFELYARDFGVSSLSLHYNNQFLETQASVTPMIIEERKLNGTALSVFDRLMMDRIIWFAGPVNTNSSTITQAQLMFLDSVDKKDITLQINSPGGGVYAGLSVIDVMDLIKSDVATMNVGMAASMGAVLLSAGKKGKRSSLRYSRTMIHQSSGGAQGTLADAKISMKEWEKINQILFNILGVNCGKTPEEVQKDADRDLWLTAEESLEYGVIDEVIGSK